MFKSFLELIASLLRPVAKPIDGQKTYLAALGLAGLAVYQYTQGDVQGALQSALAALAAAGLRNAIDKPKGGPDA